MKRKILYSILIIFILSLGFITVYADDDYSFYNNFKSQYNEFATEGGYVQENNVTTIEIALGIIAQNKKLVNHLLEVACTTSGDDYNALKDFIGVDDKGNIKLGSDKQTDVASAFYKVAYIIDTYNGMSKNLDGCADSDAYANLSKAFKDNTGKSKYNQKDANYYMHVWVGQYGGAADKTTAATFYEPNNVSRDTWNALSDYYCDYVNVDSVDAIYYEDETLKFDEKALLEDFKDIKISIGSGDSNKVSGDTTEQLVTNTVERIAEEEITTIPDETIDQNIYAQTGIEMETVRANLELKWNGGISGANDLSMALDHLLERAKKLKDAGENEKISGMSDIVVDITTIVSSVGRYIMYALILFFGVKTIWEGVEGKAKFKELLPFLLIGVVFFWAAPGIVSLVKSIFEINTDKSQDYLSTIFATIVYILRVVAFGGIIFTGVKLMFGAADKKAEVKSGLIPVLIGSIIVFTASIIIGLVLNVAKDSGIDTTKDVTQISNKT